MLIATEGRCDVFPPIFPYFWPYRKSALRHYEQCLLVGHSYRVSFELWYTRALFYNTVLFNSPFRIVLSFFILFHSSSFLVGLPHLVVSCCTLFYFVLSSSFGVDHFHLLERPRKTPTWGIEPKKPYGITRSTIQTLSLVESHMRGGVEGALFV